MIKMLAVDMDGTCLDRKSRITDNTIEALREAARAGITVVPATGRNLYCLPYRLAAGCIYQGKSRDAEKNRGLFRYVISSNGAKVSDVRKKETILQSLIRKETASALLNRCSGLNLITATHISHRYLIQGRVPAFAGRIIYGKDAKGVYCVRNMVQTVEKSPFSPEELQFYFFSENTRRKLDAVISLYPDLAAAYTSAYVEIFSAEASKGRALKALADKLGICREETACIGDADNDLSMFDASGLKIAMGNACRKLKEQADFVTCPNSRDGAAEAIRRILRDRISSCR